ncbi:MAG TPA: signal peptide peptidase SppA [Deltaproteobacteria bacterium]|nr:signal peptide peptidase SppA [Deltaproteobacteria bacterium]
MKTRHVIRSVLVFIGLIFVAIVVLSILFSFFTKESALSFGDKVAVVPIKGVITDSEEINRTLAEYGERNDIKVIVVRIDSPGGAVGPAQEIYREIRRIREENKKTVVASMGSVAASGGYYIAVAADRIVANPGTITGSIGVIVEFVNLEKLFEKIGIKGYVVKSGKFKDVGSPVREMSKEEKRLLQDVVDNIHSQFVEAVAEGRGLKVEDVQKIADGRIFSGLKAKELGLVDNLGNLGDAIRIGAELAGIKGKPSVIYPEKKLNLWKLIMGEEAGSLMSELLWGTRIMYLMPDLTR